MTLTREQLDELDACVSDTLSVRNLYLPVRHEQVTQLVTVYRAALAWNVARLAYIAALEVFEDKEDAESRSMCQRRQGEYDLARTALVAALGAP